MENKYYFVPQSNAERDKHLCETFYEMNTLSDLQEYDYTFISGRKGSGKSAISKKVYEDIKISQNGFCAWIPMLTDAIEISQDILKNKSRDKKRASNNLLLFILISLVNYSLSNNKFAGKNNVFWECWIEQNGFSHAKDFKQFVKKNLIKIKTLEPSISASLPNGMGGIGGSIGKVSTTTELRNVKINDSIDHLWRVFIESLDEEGLNAKIFIDDVDSRMEYEVLENQEIIYQIFEKINQFNRLASEFKSQIKIFICVRPDIWNFFHHSNLNKFQSDSYSIQWEEEDFYGLLSKRINPSIKSKIDIKKKKEIVHEIFNDEVFTYKVQNNKDKHFHTNFYTYIYSLSFNRPRDFLQYCWILLRKTPNNGIIEEKHINATELEYSAYLASEIKDELKLLCDYYKIPWKNLIVFMSSLANEGKFTYKKFKKKFKGFLDSQDLDNTLIKKSYDILEHFWQYSFIGFDLVENKISHFNYHNDSINLPTEKQLENENIHLLVHKGVSIAYKHSMLN